MQLLPLIINNKIKNMKEKKVFEKIQEIPKEKKSN